MNSSFTYEDIDKINEFNSYLSYFNLEYEAENELNKKLNRTAATTSLEVLKLSKTRKIALFKDKNKVIYTSLQGCSCSQYEKEDCCIHMFRLAQILNIIDSDTGTLLIPQNDFEDVPYDEQIKEERIVQKKDRPSTVGIGKHCKNCNAIIDYDAKICPSCKSDPDSVNSANEEKSQIGCFVFVIAILFFLFLGIIL